MTLSSTFGFLLSLLTFAPPSQPPEPASGLRVSINSSFYDISGESAQTLLHEMAAKSPIVEEGKTYFGHTYSEMSWRYHYTKQRGGFALTSWSVAVDVTYTMPRWSAPAEAPRSTVFEWDAYISALSLHERGHAEFAIEEASRLYAKLGEPRLFRTVAELRSYVDGQGQSAIAKAARANAEYDHRTRHGETQGVVLRHSH